MGKKEIIERLAEAADVPTCDAADELDDTVHDVLKSLRDRKHSRGNALRRLIERATCVPSEKGRSAKP